MEEKTQPKKPEKKQAGRIPWHVDLKWFFGIIATLLLTLSLTSLAAYRASSSPQIEKLAKANKSSQQMMGSIFSAPKEGADFKIKLGGKEYSMQELEKLPEGEAEKLFAEEMKKGGNSYLSKLMGPGGAMTKKPMQDNPVQGNPAQGKPGEMMDSESLMMQMIAEQAILPAVGNFLSKTVKQVSLVIFIGTLLGAIFFLGLSVAFSHRLGRLTTFSVVLLLSASPAFKISLLFKLLDSAASSPTASAGGAAALPGASSLALLPKALADANFGLFSGIIAFSLLAIFFSMIFGLIARPKAKPQPKAPAPVAKAA